MKRIIFNLKREWYDKIASGEKTVEYRRECDYWASRIGTKVGRIARGLDTFDTSRDRECYLETHPSCIMPINWFAVFRLGYSRKYPDIVRRITMIDIGQCPYEGWGGNYYRIHFDKEDAE